MVDQGVLGPFFSVNGYLDTYERTIDFVLAILSLGAVFK
jgi:hypothetical protein